MPLAPLEQPAARLLVVQLTDDAPLPAHVAAAIAARSDGSPLFVTEMVARDARGRRSRHAARVGRGVDGAADRRARRAPIAECCGRPRSSASRFTRADLVAALELDDAEAEAVLERLEGFLVAGDDGSPAFRHGLLRDAAYHGLSFRRRRVLHRRVGESLELARRAPTSQASQPTSPITSSRPACGRRRSATA